MQTPNLSVTQWKAQELLQKPNMLTFFTRVYLFEHIMCIRRPRSEYIHTQVPSYLSPAPAQRFAVASTAMHIL